MQTNVRKFKAHLLNRVEARVAVTIWVDNRLVAEIVPMRKKLSVKQLSSDPGIAWNGRKPADRRPKALPKAVSVSGWVCKDRR